MDKGIKLVVTGNARHGKDTVCEILKARYGYKFTSSSELANKLVIFDKLKDKYNYKTLEECFLDRDNHRKEWYDLIVEFNTPDLARLGRIIFEKSDIYCGLRNRAELLAMRDEKLVTLTVWVDAKRRLKAESSDSITILESDCSITVDNNGTLEDLNKAVDNLVGFINKYRNFYY